METNYGTITDTCELLMPRELAIYATLQHCCEPYHDHVVSACEHHFTKDKNPNYVPCATYGLLTHLMTNSL